MVITNNARSNFILTETAQRLLERLAHLKLQPKNILLQDSSNSIELLPLITLYPAAKISLIPEQNITYDLIIDNCSLLYTLDLKWQLFSFKKLLTNDGLLIFCTLGLATFPQYRHEFNPNLKLLDMHNLGDLILNLHFKDPVMEMEILNLNYKTLKTFNQDLQAAKLSDHPLELENPSIATTLEIIYGHAWHTDSHHQYLDENNNILISADSIGYMD